MTVQKSSNCLNISDNTGKNEVVHKVQGSLKGIIMIAGVGNNEYHFITIWRMLKISLPDSIS